MVVVTPKPSIKKWIKKDKPKPNHLIDVKQTEKLVPPNHPVYKAPKS